MVDSPHGVVGDHVTSHVTSEYESEHARARTRYQPEAEQTVREPAKIPNYAMLTHVPSKPDLD